MAFHGIVKPKRWNQLLRPMDNISRVMGECVFNYDYSWCTNSDILEIWIGCLARAKVEKWDIIRLCYNLFYPRWLVGLEQVVFSIDEKLKILLPEAYMAHQPDSFELATIPRRPSLVIRDNILVF